MAFPGLQQIPVAHISLGSSRCLVSDTTSDVWSMTSKTRSASGFRPAGLAFPKAGPGSRTVGGSRQRDLGDDVRQPRDASTVHDPDSRVGSATPSGHTGGRRQVHCHGVADRYGEIIIAPFESSLTETAFTWCPRRSTAPSTSGTPWSSGSASKPPATTTAPWSRGCERLAWRS